MRNTKIDACRGIAILIMVLANSAPYILINVEIPFILRFLFSLAAPIFIFLSGYSLHLSFGKGKKSKKILIRSLQIVFIAVLIDVFIWRIVPFQTFDVLYLIGFSQIALILINKFNIKIKTIIFFLSIIIYVILILNCNYRFKQTENNLVYGHLSFYSSLIRMLFDGWFPFFPWFSISMAGYLSYNYKEQIKNNSILLMIGGVFLLIISYILFIIFPSYINLPREKYLELFYPINNIYFLSLLGILTIILVFITSKLKIKPFPTIIGKFSLFFYILHTIIINFLIIDFVEYINCKPFARFIIIGILFQILLFLTSRILDVYLPYFSRNKKNKPLLFVLGF
jgi:fucose 4-O-acetylase-like acetyltransferase